MSDYVIGLTGGIACGKSHLSQALREAGAPVIDADGISRALTAEGGAALPFIRDAFGDGVFDGDRLDRRALAQVVFGDEGQLKKLNGLLHPLIFAQMRRQMDAVTGPVVLDVPLLYETGMDAWCDEVWCAYASQQEQIARLRRRDGLTGKEALRRIRAQMPTREKKKRADRTIDTRGTQEDSARAVLALWQSALEKRQSRKGEPAI